jgi:hypothetical protein
MIKDILNEWKEELGKLTGNSILSLKILFPTDESLTSLDQVLFINAVDRIKYKNFEDAYIKPGKSAGARVTRSLTFLKYNDSIKYNNISGYVLKEDIANNEVEKDLTYHKQIAINFSKSQVKNLSNSNNVDLWWNDWCELMPCHFPKAKSTLWTYINIRRSTNTSIICSCYLIFSKKIKIKNQHLVNKISQDYLFKIVLGHFENKLFSTALQSSLSAVASRNQSHNIGSHVLNNLSNPEQIKKFLDDKGYKNLYKCSDNEPHKEKRYHLVGKCKINMLSNYISKDDVKPEQLIAHFNTYLKARMDFIADVGTSVQSSLMNTSNLFDEVFAYFEKNLILLREISGKEDEFQYGFNLHYNNDKDKKGPRVAMPNGLLGQQAFYIILENIIRNTAKHESISKNDKVCFTIDANSKTEGVKKDFCEITIYSNLLKKKNNLKSLLEKRNESINRPVLDPDNTVREGGWGTIEMKLSAAYLRGINLLDIDNEAYNVTGDYNENVFPIFEAVSKKAAGKEYFGYRFYVCKPKLALIVFEENDINKIKVLNNNEGIAAVLKKDESLENEIFNHDFLIYVGKDFNEAEWNNKKNLPQRIIHFEQLTLKNLEEDKIFDLYLESLSDKIVWAKWGEYNRFSFDNEHEILFDRHGSNFQDCQNNYHFIEPHSSASLIGQLLNNENIKVKSSIKLQAFEAVDLKVVILDERAQNSNLYLYYPEEESQDNTKREDGILFAEIYNKVGIKVPFTEEQMKIISERASDFLKTPTQNCLNLNSTKLSNCRKGFFKFIVHNENAHYLVIHFGILESIKLPSEKLEDIITKIRLKISKKTKLVIISGRGQTKDIPRNEYFINQSSFSYFLDNQFGRSKLHLVALLKSARAKNI